MARAYVCVSSGRSESINSYIADALAHSDAGRQRAELALELERVLEEVLAADKAFTIKQLAIGGSDLLERGIPAGPEIGTLLNAALDAVIDERIVNEKSELLKFVDELR